MSRTKYGLIGCGMMGHEHIRNIQLLDNTAIGAIFEPDDSMRITSPNFNHVSQLKTIADTRPLPVLVEKPLSTDLADKEIIEDLAATYPKPIWVAMEYRYMPPLAEFIRRAEEVTGGITMLSIREHRFPFLEKVNDWNRFNRYSGGTLVEKCCHFFDLMRFVLKAEPASVMATASQSCNHLDERYDGETPDIIDNSYTIVDFDNGSRALLELCMFAEGSRYQEEISAVGKNGKIECLIPGPTRFWPPE